MYQRPSHEVSTSSIGRTALVVLVIAAVDDVRIGERQVRSSGEVDVDPQLGRHDSRARQHAQPRDHVRGQGVPRQSPPLAVAQDRS